MADGERMELLLTWLEWNLRSGTNEARLRAGMALLMLERDGLTAIVVKIMAEPFPDPTPESLEATTWQALCAARHERDAALRERDMIREIADRLERERHEAWTKLAELQAAIA